MFFYFYQKECFIKFWHIIVLLFFYFNYNNYLNCSEYQEYLFTIDNKSPIFNDFFEIDTDSNTPKYTSLKTHKKNDYSKINDADENEEKIKVEIENLTVLNSIKTSFSKKIAKSFMCSLGLTGGIPLLSIADKAAGDSVFFKIYFGMGTLLTNGVTASWYLDNFYTYFFSHQYFIKQKTRENQNYIIDYSFLTSKIKPLFLICLSLFDTVPITYIAYRYNRNKLYPILAFSSEFGVKIFGYYKLIEQLTYEKDIKKQRYLYKMRNFFTYLLSLSNTEEQKVKLDNFKLTEEINAENIMILLKNIKDDESYLDYEINDDKEKFVKIVKILSVVLFIANAVKRGTFAYRGMKTVLSSDLCSILLSVPSTLSSLGVAYFSINNTIERMGSYLYNKNSRLNFINVFHNNYNNYVYVASLILAFSSAYSFSYATFDVLSQIYPIKIAHVITLLTIINGTLVDSFSLRECINNYLTLFYSLYGKEYEIRILKIKKYLDILYSIILNMTEDQFSTFYNMLENEKNNNLEELK